MAYVNGNKPIITTGLVYALDFGNPKSYTTGLNTARSLVFDTAVTTVTGSSGLPTLTNGILNITSSQFIRRTGSLDSIDPNGAFTISLVAKPNTVGSLLTQNLTGKVFQVQSTPSSSNIGFSLGTGTYSRTIPGFNSSSLQHISFRYNSGSIDTFLNGIPVTSSIANSSIFPTTQLNALFFGSGSNSFSGSLANLYVYNRALSPDEIYENYLVMAGRYGLPVVPKPYSIDENLYQWIQATNTTDSNTISAVSTFISGLKSAGLWNKLQVIYPFVGTTTGSQTVNLKEPGLYRLGLTGSFSASNAGLYPSSSTSYVDSIPSNTVYPLVNSASAHLSLLSYDLPTGNGFLGGNSARAFGGDLIISSGSRMYHAYLNTGTSSFVMGDPSITSVEVLVVAGGGSGDGGGYQSGGGGAGGLVYSSSFSITPGSPITTIVGAGGRASNGQNSVFSTITALGGGRADASGGSGGGGGSTFSSTGSGGFGTPGQGNNGGFGLTVYDHGSGGGGGAGAPGENAGTTASRAGSGGNGLYFPQYVGTGLGYPVGWFAGGGGGSNDFGSGGFNVGSTGSGGLGGGGNGSRNINNAIAAQPGKPNTGGGGGGRGYNDPAGGSLSYGGSGIVIVSYNLPASALTGSGTGLYITETGITGSVNSQFTSGITGSGNIGFVMASRTQPASFTLHKNNVSQSVASASLGALPTDIFFNTANLAGSGSLPLQANLAYASLGAGLTTSEITTYYNLVSQLQNNLKRQSTLLDTYSGAAAAYSLRRIGPSGYFGSAIRVRRDSDNALRDIGFTSDGQLDTVGLLDFVGVTGSGFVETWYDQSGNRYDTFQNTAANQPLVVVSGSILTYNKKPTIDFLTVEGKTLATATNVSIPSPTTVFITAQKAKRNGGYYFDGKTANNRFGILVFPGQYQLFTTDNSGVVLSANIGSSLPVGSASLMTIIKNGANSQLYENTSLLGTTTLTTDNFTGLTIGSRYTTDSPADKYQEFIVYSSNQSSNRTAIESNINTNYKIYGSATASFDPDYQAFITATGITEPTQSAALETLVSDLKSYGLWSKMKAIYPMVTDRNNRFAQSEDFSQTWNPISSSVTVNQITAPNGTATADLVLEEAGSGDHYVYQTVTNLVSGNEYILSVYGKYLNRPWIALQTNDGAQAWFNIQTGLTGSFTGSRTTITPVSGGWYRCALFYTASSDGAKNQHIHLADTDGNYSYVGVATTGSYLWGAQFENGNVLGPYRVTSGSSYTTSSMLDQMKFNLRNPADTDAAFRLTYSGSWNAGYSGVKSDGTTAWASTKLTPSTNLPLNSTHFSLYLRNTPTGLDYQGSESGGRFMINYNVNTIYSDHYGAGTGRLVTSVASSRGFVLTSRTSTTSHRVYQNQSLINSTTGLSDSSAPTTHMYIGGANITGNSNPPIYFATAPLGFTTLGDGLTDYEAKALYWIVQKFQTTLGRQVY